jgi:hypothetical protein
MPSRPRSHALANTTAPSAVSASLNKTLIDAGDQA